MVIHNQLLGADAPPLLTAAYLEERATEEYTAIGVLGGFLLQEPLRVLMLTHKAGEKSREGQLGPMGELVRARWVGESLEMSAFPSARIFRLPQTY